MSGQLFPKNVIKTKIVGVTMDDIGPDGRPLRQIYLENMAKKDIRLLKLVPEPDNMYDKDAIAVYGDYGEGLKKLGYISNKFRVCEVCGETYSKPKPETVVCQRCKGPLSRAGLAVYLSKFMRAGYEFRATVLQYTGGREPGDTIGCNICIEPIN